MTRKHFRDLAETLQNLKPRGKSKPQKLLWENIVTEMALLCKRHNYNFDEQRFYEACGRKERM